MALLAVEEAGDEEEHGEHEGELSMRAGVEVELDDSIPEPYGTSEKPDPGGFAHRLRSRWVGQSLRLRVVSGAGTLGRWLRVVKRTLMSPKRPTMETAKT